MHSNPGHTALTRPAALPAPCPDFSEEQLIAFDRGYAAAKDTGALDRTQALAALNLDLSHNRSARLA
ncbi:hypothetical protein [Variovorax sp. EBFNA2]|uniref:hypothetical protein n=1 Tax=Variovorax sp. EBFNA2 TaxID=3342097 RepID=UPI0029C0C1C9|nr:hypothetical protein [Variovorax boronicumulans]WPG35338.1 hypothetical protein RZE79_17785 [Variovorax boronicumulans]